MPLNTDRPTPTPSLRTIEELEDALSDPTDAVVESLRKMPGDMLVLGVGGKMGPTLARMAKRAAQRVGMSRRVIGVSRFRDADLRERLERWGVETLACDLLDEQDVARLPDAPWVVSMAGYKFGAAANPSLTWAMNCYLPAIVSRRFHNSRLVAFSSGNVYGFTPVAGGGSVETDELHPVGEYAITILGRERMYDYFSRHQQTPMALLRLNYATELRYGVLVDIGRSVWNNEPIDVSVGYVNVIWQRDANAMSLQSLAEVGVPATVLNIAGSEILRVRDVARRFGELMGRRPQFSGEESNQAFLNNARATYQKLGEPLTTADEMIRWTADWIMNGGASLNKPTHFDSRDGRY